VIVWHYTTGNALPAIVRSGKLRPSTRPGEPRIVWCSTRQDFEPAVCKFMERRTGLADAIRLILPPQTTEDVARLWRIVAAYGHVETPAEMEKRGRGLYRVGVAPETAPYDWPAIVRLSGISEFEAYCVDLTDYMRANGTDRADWRGSFEPIPADLWLAVEKWDGHRWRSWSADGGKRLCWRLDERQTEASAA
jgi:hypothetical protein